MQRMKLSPKDIEEIIKLFRQGYGQLQIAKRYDVDHSTIYYHLKKHKIEKTPEIEAKAKKLANRILEKKGEIVEDDLESKDIYCIVKPPKKVKGYADYLKKDINSLETKLSSVRNSEARTLIRKEISYKNKAKNSYNSGVKYTDRDVDIFFS